MQTPPTTPWTLSIFHMHIDHYLVKTWIYLSLVYDSYTQCEQCTNICLFARYLEVPSTTWICFKMFAYIWETEQPNVSKIWDKLLWWSVKQQKTELNYIKDKIGVNGLSMQHMRRSSIGQTLLLEWKHQGFESYGSINIWRLQLIKWKHELLVETYSTSWLRSKRATW